MRLTNGPAQAKSGRRRKLDVLYPIHAEADYVLRRGKRIVETGHGQTVSLKGNRLVLDSVKRLASGMDVELTMLWPAPAGNLQELMLRIKGRTAGGQGNQTAVRIGQYDFEARSGSADVPDLPADPPSKAVKASGSAHLPHPAPPAP